MISDQFIVGMDIQYESPPRQEPNMTNGLITVPPAATNAPSSLQKEEEEDVIVIDDSDDEEAPPEDPPITQPSAQVVPPIADPSRGMPGNMDEMDEEKAKEYLRSLGNFTR